MRDFVLRYLRTLHDFKLDQFHVEYYRLLAIHGPSRKNDHALVFPGPNKFSHIHMSHRYAIVGEFAGRDLDTGQSNDIPLQDSVDAEAKFPDARNGKDDLPSQDLHVDQAATPFQEDSANADEPND